MADHENNSGCGACLGILVLCSHFTRVVCPHCGKVHIINTAEKTPKIAVAVKNKEIDDYECHLGHA